MNKTIAEQPKGINAGIPGSLGSGPAPVPVKAYSIVSVGHSDLWVLREYEITGDKTRVLRETVPNTRDICIGRSIACLEGMDGFSYGESA